MKINLQNSQNRKNDILKQAWSDTKTLKMKYCIVF